MRRLGFLPTADTDRTPVPCFTVQTAAPVACELQGGETPYPTRTPVAPCWAPLADVGSITDLQDEWLWICSHRAATSHPWRSGEGGPQERNPEKEDSRPWIGCEALRNIQGRSRGCSEHEREKKKRQGETESRGRELRGSDRKGNKSVAGDCGQRFETPRLPVGVEGGFVGVQFI
jgi:hypothetical protein